MAEVWYGKSIIYTVILSVPEQATEKVSFFRLEMYMYILTVFIKEYNMPAESKSHYLFKVQYCR